MAIKDKADLLATRMGIVPAKLHSRMDAILGRFDAVESHGDATFSGIETILDDAEQGVVAAEQAMARLSNAK